MWGCWCRTWCGCSSGATTGCSFRRRGAARRRHAGAHSGRSEGAAGGRGDRGGGRPGVHLSTALAVAGPPVRAGQRRRGVMPQPTLPVCLEVRQLSYRYPHFALQAVNFSLHRGELLAIIGPNASGKSTLLKLLAGLLLPEAGAGLVDGRPVGALNLRERARRIAVVQQESPLLFPIRVLPFVLQGRYAYLRALGFEGQDDLEVARLARALAQEPELLLLDEPTLHLDIGFQVELLRLVQQLARREGYAVALVSHELNLAAEFAASVLLLQQGRPLRLGPPAEVLERELLEQVFETELEVLIQPETGRPRVVLRAAPDAPEKGGPATS